MSVLDRAISVVKGCEADMEIAQNLLEQGYVDANSLEIPLTSEHETILGTEVIEKKKDVNKIIKQVNIVFEKSFTNLQGWVWDAEAQDWIDPEA